jgi:hypothetical protein
MTIEEIKKAKREAEEQVTKLLVDLQHRSGLQLRGVDVQLVSWHDGHGYGTCVGTVTIDLKV